MSSQEGEGSDISSDISSTSSESDSERKAMTRAMRKFRKRMTLIMVHKRETWHATQGQV